MLIRGSFFSVGSERRNLEYPVQRFHESCDVIRANGNGMTGGGALCVEMGLYADIKGIKMQL